MEFWKFWKCHLEILEIPLKMRKTDENGIFDLTNKARRTYENEVKCSKSTNFRNFQKFQTTFPKFPEIPNRACAARRTSVETAK
jgi:hypothetical protein